MTINTGIANMEIITAEQAEEFANTMADWCIQKTDQQVSLTIWKIYVFRKFIEKLCSKSKLMPVIAVGERNEILLPTTKKMLSDLEKLERNGLYGENIAEVAARLVCNELIRLGQEPVK